MSCTGAIPKRGPKSTLPKEKDSTEVIGEPLDQKYISVTSQGIERRVPALHQSWTKKCSYLKYERPPPPVMPDGSLPPAGASESWIERMELMEEDLRGLLLLPHHKFWSQMLYDRPVHVCLESYLSGCPRWYEEDQTDALCQEVAGSLHRLVLLIYIRMATPRESSTCHITPSIFAQIIYENFFLDVCKLLDLSVVYGPSCSGLLSRMMASIFRHQPEYYKDLAHTVSSIARALESVENSLGVSDCGIPVPLDAVNESLSESDLQTVVLFLLDTFSSLHLFLSLHPAASKYFLDEVDELRISSFYEQVVPAITSQLSDLSHGELNPRLVKEINMMRSSMLATFRALLHHKCLAPLQEDKLGTAVAGECVEKFLNIMSTCVAERIFITDYCSAYPFTADLKAFTEKGGDITSLNFISEAITTVLKEMDSLPRAGMTLPLEQLSLPNPTQSSQDSVDTSGMNGYAQEGSGATPDLDVAAGVSSVQELLPDLGAGFIKECLRYYNHCPEEVINALLEDNLPPSLASLDRTAPLRPDTPPPPSSEESQPQLPPSGILEQRLNVYDNDEFDMFTRPNVDRSKIHKGKKNTTNKSVLYEKDETVVEKLKEIGKQYEERGGTSIYEDEMRYEAEEENYRPWDYEDEYDDTYDDNETGDIDDLGPEKVVRRRPGIIGAGRLNTGIVYGQQSEEEKSEDEAEEEAAKEQQESNAAVNGVQQRGGRPNTGAKPRVPKVNTRGVQRVFTNTSKASKSHTPTPEREYGVEGREEQQPANAPRQPPQQQYRPAFQPFCENPEVTRQRAEQRRRDREYNRGYRGQGSGQVWRRAMVVNGVEEAGGGGEGGGGGGGGGGGPGRPKMATNKHSGKGWRHGEGDEDRGGYKGGKFKEDTNHGRAQSSQHRHKMIHKNEHKRQGAQAKFNRNN